MDLRRYRVMAATLVLCAGVMGARGQQTSSPAPPRLSHQTKLELIHGFTSDLVYIRTPFPMGKTGLSIRHGAISPSGEELHQMIAMWGPAVKPGDQATISSILVKDDHIRFEINGGPVRKQKWYQHVQVGMGGNGSVTPSDNNANPRGSYVDLYFDHYVPELGAQELKALLHPVFDFDAKSAEEAFLDTVPPKVRDAIKNHQVLVGMNRDMVLYAKGRTDRKIREKDGETEYEDWIYGTPPQDVEFVRLVGDEVIRVEVMKVGGEKVVRTEKEVDLGTQPTVAAAGSGNTARPVGAPTLRRPGEELPGDAPQTAPDAGPKPGPLPTPPPPSQPGPGNNLDAHFVYAALR